MPSKLVCLMTACYLVTETHTLPVSGIWKMSVCYMAQVPFLLLVKEECGQGLGQDHCSNSFLQVKELGSSFCSGNSGGGCWWCHSPAMMADSAGHFTEYSAINLIILFITWLLLLLFKIPLSVTPSLPTGGRCVRHGFICVSYFPSPPLKKTPSLGS